MLERKKLVYGDGKLEGISKPRVMRNLVFSATFLAVTSCSHTTNTIPRRDPVVEETRRTLPRPVASERTIGGCFPDLRNISVESEETVTETVCRGEQGIHTYKQASLH